MKSIKKTSIICGFIFCIFSYLNAQTAESFKMRNQGTDIQNIKSTFNSMHQFELADKKYISGLSVSGNVVFKSEFGLIRIIMEDEDGNDYLVLESSPMLANSNKFAFDNLCEETALLNHVKASKMKIIIKDAELYLGSVNSADASLQKTISSSGFENTKATMADSQLKAKISSINEYNLKNDNLWFAGETPLAKLSYNEKKKLFGITEDDFDTQGYEYYVSGYFVFKSEENSENKISTRSASAYIADFDWRNRHGINWDTSIKHQGYLVNGVGGGGCWVFAPIACAEVYTNLYFNRKIDLDLSEQNVLNCVTSGSVTTGGYNDVSMDYITANGVVKESVLPFQNNQTACVNFAENLKTKFESTGTIYQYTNANKEETFKEALISKGPMAAQISRPWSHAMLLVGYGKVRAGDRIRTSETEYMTIPTSSSHIGKTYWIYKNSYGIQNEGDVNDGYHYFIFDNYSHMGSSAYYFSGTVTTPGYTSSGRICDDKDGDGFYTWFGTKPSNAPVSQTVPDGDDSDPDLGTLLVSGECGINSGVLIISTNTTVNSSQTKSQHIRVKSDVALNINSGTYRSSSKRLTLEKHATLNVSASGSLEF